MSCDCAYAGRCDVVACPPRRLQRSAAEREVPGCSNWPRYSLSVGAQCARIHVYALNARKWWKLLRILPPRCHVGPAEYIFRAGPIFPLSHLVMSNALVYVICTTCVHVYINMCVCIFLHLSCDGNERLWCFSLCWARCSLVTLLRASVYTMIYMHYFICTGHDFAVAWCTWYGGMLIDFLYMCVANRNKTLLSVPKIKNCSKSTQKTTTTKKKKRSAGEALPLEARLSSFCALCVLCPVSDVSWIPN